MSIVGFLMPETTDACPYLEGRSATMEHFLVEALEEGDLDQLLQDGYRHFGTYFFRSVCRMCHKCVPIRIPLAGYSFSSGAKRILKRAARFEFRLGPPKPSREAFDLFRRHKQRFEGSTPESYGEFVRSFFHAFSWSNQLSIYDQARLIAVSHVDITKTSLSAVYCYYDDSYSRESLGSLAILKEIEIGMERGASNLYLGYYIAENRHMSYKARFRPCQVLLEEGRWVDYLDQKGNMSDNIEKIEFFPKQRLQGGD